MKRVLIVSADQFEDTELLVPYYRLKEAGIGVAVASPGGGSIKGKHGYSVDVDMTVSEADPGEFDALVLPGGRAPAALRKDEATVALARRFMEEGKPVAAICHGPQLLVTAGVMRDRRATCYHKVAPELREAGTKYEDSEVVVDGNLVTSRRPGDLPAFTRELMRKLR